MLDGSLLGASYGLLGALGGLLGVSWEPLRVLLAALGAFLARSLTLLEASGRLLDLPGRSELDFRQILGPPRVDFGVPGRVLQGLTDFENLRFFDLES